MFGGACELCSGVSQYGCVFVMKLKLSTSVLCLEFANVLHVG
jgi:hypothetical protein